MDRIFANNRANERRNVRFRDKADKVDGRGWRRAQLDDLVASYLDDDICAQKEVDQDQSRRWRLKNRYQDNGGSNRGGTQTSQGIHPSMVCPFLCRQGPRGDQKRSA